MLVAGLACAGMVAAGIETCLCRRTPVTALLSTNGTRVPILTELSSNCTVISSHAAIVLYLVISSHTAGWRHAVRPQYILEKMYSHFSLRMSHEQRTRA